MSEEDPPAKRMRLGGDGLVELSKEELIAEHKKQEMYIATLVSKLDGSACGSGTQGDLEERLKLQHAEACRKEKVLLMQLTRKEQELQEIATQLGELTKGNTPGASQLRSALLDPTLNILFQRMRYQLDEKSKKLQQATDDMAAWKFTPDSQTGKRLMSKCRTLIQENQELGKQVSTGRTAQLEAELALQKKYSEELKASQDELNEFVIQLDEEVEGMQSTICALQHQLKEAKDELVATKAKHTEPSVLEQLIPQQQVHKLVAQQEPEQEERSTAWQQVEAPESPVSEPGPDPTPSSPAPKSPPQGVAAGNRTPNEVSFAVSAAGEGTDSKSHHPWTADDLETNPLVEEGGPGGDDRTADRTIVSCREEEKERTTTEKQEENERTTKMSKEQVRTFSYEEMETQKQQQQRGEEEEEEKKITHKVMVQDLKDTLHEECREQQERCQQWDQEQQHMQQQKQEQQQQEEAEEEMEIDLSRFENDSSSTESEAYSVDIQQSKSAGELTSPVASCEISKTLAGDDSDEGFNTMTPDQGFTEPSSSYQGLDQTQDDTHNSYESPLETKSSVEPSGNSYHGVVDSSSSGQGTEGSSTETREVQDASTNNQDNAVTSQTEGVSNSTFQNQLTLGKVVPESPILNQSAQEPLLSEVKVTAKKLPHNCSLSVVDYDTGSSDEDDYTGDEDDGGFVEEPPRLANKSLPLTTNNSPTNISPESPHHNLSPENSSPTSPVNNTSKLESDVTPLKSLSVQMPPGNEDSDAGLLTKLNEHRDLGYIEENGTISAHDDEPVATATD